MATLYTHKGENIRRTWLLIGAFIVLVAGLGWVFSYVFEAYIIFPIAVAFAVMMSLGSYWFSDKIVVSLAGAKPIEKKDDPELYRLVENLCITAGLPMPRLYLVDSQAMNAFATGRNPDNAVVAVTRGLREKLNRTELEGVLAHELSHIGNRDMKVATIAAVLAGVIVIMVDMVWRMMFWGGMGRDRRQGGSVLILIAAVVAIVLAPLAATLLRMAVSRQREFLADSSGALLTRYPEGLASALEKIASHPVGMRKGSDAIAHLWIDEPEKQKRGKSFFTRMFMTHPPVEERVLRLRKLRM